MKQRRPNSEDTDEKANRHGGHAAALEKESVGGDIERTARTGEGEADAAQYRRESPTAKAGPYKKVPRRRRGAEESP